MMILIKKLCVTNNVKIRYNKSDILLIDKIKKELLILRKYDEFANVLGLIHGCKTKIIPYVITWDGIMSKYHSKHRKELGITDRIEAYIYRPTNNCFSRADTSENKLYYKNYNK
ncbi:hypothetical protein NAPIS_ORF01346 [Vairimorpha apis BRL 01]|uniref:Uncharacterized protein n=1 Tax=Vairimorpha apis BRL 01 TaxID=1037528 RepID=T0MJH7_9MICR|nr:hypothetical protein NAPIS_ORF01346 [Vairimorpha apis BRL 01]